MAPNIAITGKKKKNKLDISYIPGSWKLLIWNSYWFYRQTSGLMQCSSCEKYFIGWWWEGWLKGFFDFSVVVSIYKIKCFDEVSFPRSNRCNDNWKKCLFPISMATIVREINSSNKTIQTINEKKWSQTDNEFSKNVVIKVIKEIKETTMLLLWSFYLTHFMPMVSFYTPWKQQKTYRN